MEIRNKKKEIREYRNGFTLIEMLVVISIFALLTTGALTFSMDEYHHDSFSDEQMALVSTLQKAREEAMNAVCMGNSCSAGTDHGVYFETHDYILFQGDTYSPNDPQNEIYDVNPTIKLSGVTEVIFATHSGDASTTPVGVWDIVLTDNSGHISTTTVNSEGRIE